MDQQREAPKEASTAQTGRKLGFFVRRFRRQETSGQAIVEFAIVSVAFFLMVFGTIDFGRAIYMYSQLHNAVREGARYGKINPADESGIKTRVVDYASSFDLASDDITVDCNPGCVPGCDDVTVTASASFSAITQEFLGIDPITMTSTAKVNAE